MTNYSLPLFLQPPVPSEYWGTCSSVFAQLFPIQEHIWCVYTVCFEQQMRMANSVAAWCLYSTCTNSRAQWLHDTGRISLESTLDFPLGEK